MPQFTIKPATLANQKVSFMHNTGITIDSIENIYAIAVNFNVDDTINASTELKTTEGYQGGDFIPEIVVNYTEI